MPEVRLQKALADAGIASRRAAEALIVAGRITVDGTRATLGQRVDPGRSAIAVDGRPLVAAPAPVHLALHKPAGVTATVADRHAAATILDVVPRDVLDRAGRLYPVGRLDRESEGLLLLTNDGAWADRVLHPRYEIEREYAVGVLAPLDQQQRHALLSGFDLEEGRATFNALRAATAAETAGLLASVGPGPVNVAWYRVTLAQGWKRQVRRMFAAAGVSVVRLVRVRIGPVRLGSLRSGEVRVLTRSEWRGFTPAGAARRGADTKPPAFRTRAGPGMGGASGHRRRAEPRAGRE